MYTNHPTESSNLWQIGQVIETQSAPRISVVPTAPIDTYTRRLSQARGAT